MSGQQTSKEFGVAEYVALTALRAIVKALRRLIGDGAFREPRIAELVESSTNMLAECVCAIEAYDPSAMVLEAKDPAKKPHPHAGRPVQKVEAWRKRLQSKAVAA